MFASGRPEIGQNQPTAKLYAQTLPREAWADASARLDLSVIKNLVAVHRLREVSCLYGFTRFEAAPTSADGELEDVQLAVHGAPISQNADWLPAIEQFGEGIFLHFDEAAIARWLDKDATRRQTWVDIFCAVFTTTAGFKIVTLSGLTPRTTVLAPTDATLADDTVVDGVLGDRLRLKITSTGTFGSGSVISARVACR